MRSASPPPVTLDLVISHYRVLHAIGKGGMGEVYLGVDETLRRKVALKSISPEHRLDAATKARFLREARTLSQLDHPNICRVYDYIETPDRDWIVLELVEGETLSTAIGRGRLTPPERLTIARQIAEVLVATHTAGVIHRDLKPGNVMLTPTGDVKVLDFGLSATMDVEPRSAGSVAARSAVFALSSSDETWSPADLRAAASAEASQFKSEAGIKGTVAYMSPEQARGESAASASDMYSFGLILQEVYTGRHPYAKTSTQLQLLEKAARGETEAPDGMPANLAALVVRLKSLAPAQRPTAIETLERLRWIADAPARLRRNLMIAAVLVAVIFGTVKYTVDLSRERNAALQARDEARQRRGQAESLIGFMVGDLRTKLNAVGRLEILDDVGKQALAYFNSVSADSLSDEELFRRSQALHQLGQVREARADIPGALKAYEDSLTQAEAVVQRKPENAEWQLGLGTSHFYVGNLKMRGGDLDGALAHFQAYKQIAERLVAREPDNFTWKLEESYGHSNVAAIYSRQGNLDNARKELEIVASLQADLAKQKPSDQELQTSRANNLNRLAIVQDSLGDLQGAVASFQRELEIYAALLASDSRNMRVRRRAQVSHAYCGLTLSALDRSKEAADHFRAAYDEAQALVELDPSNADWQRDLAIARRALARLEIENDPGKALGLFRESFDTFETLAKKNPTRATEQRDLARTHASIAEALRRTRRLDAAGKEIDSALRILEPLVAKNPRDIESTLALALAGNERGLISAAMGRTRDAKEAWTKAVNRLSPLAANSKDRNLLDPWVRALVYLGRIDEARRGFDRLTAIGYRERAFLELWEQVDRGPAPH
jgi:serine/threonine protein kinase